MSEYQPMYDTFQSDIRERYVPTSRISVSASVFLPGSDIDFATGQLKPDRVRRHRTQAQRLEAERLEKEDRKLKASIEREMKKTGVRVTWLTALVICAALVIGCLFTIDHQWSVLNGIQDQRNDVAAAIESCEAACKEVKEEIGRVASDTQIRFAAAQNLNMVPAESVEAIYLVPVDTRPMASAAQKNQPEKQNITVDVQATQAPAIASAGN